MIIGYAAEESNPDRRFRRPSRFPLRQRRSSTPPEDRTLFRRVKAGCIASMLAGPVTVFDCRLPVRCYPPSGFQPGAAAWLVQPPLAEGAVIETDGVTRASLSGRARYACPVHLPCAGRESNPDVRRHTLLRRARLPVTPPAH